jgi:hypothetical protein
VCKGRNAERLAIIDALFSLHFLEMHTRIPENRRSDPMSQITKERNS